MKPLELKPHVYYTGVQDHDLRTFDIIMTTTYGTSYNSYLIQGSEHGALVEIAKLNFFDEYWDKVQSVISPDKIDYLIVNHTEPDHVGSITKLLALCPHLTVIGTAGAIGFLKQIANCDFASRIVKDGDTLSLGDKTLQFFMLPNLHWPDTMYTYLAEDKLLFTCDSFGAHYAHDAVLRSTVTDEDAYWSAAKYYFDCILSPFSRPFMVNGIKKVRSLDVDMIATGHGPVLDAKLPELLARYDEWCKADRYENKTVVIAYVSAYGYTKMLADAIADGIRKAGVTALLFDAETTDAATILTAIGKADGLLLGSPTILGDALPPIWALTSSMHAPIHGGKYAAAFGSYGWSGEAVPHLTERLQQLKLKVSDGLRVRFCPSEQELTAAAAFGETFAAQL